MMRQPIQWVRQALKTIATTGDYNDPLYLVFAIDDPVESYDGSLPTTDPYYEYRTLPGDNPYSEFYAFVPGLGYRRLDYQRWKWHIDCRRYSLATGVDSETVTLYSPPDVDLSAGYTSKFPYGKRYYPRMRKGIYGVWQPSTNYVFPVQAPEEIDEYCVIAKDYDNTDVVVRMLIPERNDYTYCVDVLAGSGNAPLIKTIGRGPGHSTVYHQIGKAPLSPYRAGLGKFIDEDWLLTFYHNENPGTYPPDTSWLYFTGSPYGELNEEHFAFWNNKARAMEQYVYFYDVNIHDLDYYDSFRDGQLNSFKRQTEITGAVCGWGFEYNCYAHKILQDSGSTYQAKMSVAVGAVKPLAGNMICKINMHSLPLFYDPNYGDNRVILYHRMKPMPFVIMALDCEKHVMDGTVNSLLSPPAFKVGEFTLTDNIADSLNWGWSNIKVELPDFCARQHGRWTWLSVFPKSMIDGNFDDWMEPLYRPVVLNISDTRTQEEIEATMLSYVTDIDGPYYEYGSKYYKVKAAIPYFQMSLGMTATFTNENTS